MAKAKTQPAQAEPEVATRARTPYRALVGLDYPPDRRVEPGEIADDIPPTSAVWLLEQGLIRELTLDEAQANEAASIERLNAVLKRNIAVMEDK